MAGKMRSLRRAQRPKKMRQPRGAVYSTGPKELYLRQDPHRQTGPGEPPEGFVSGNTSRSEWFFYWGLAEWFEDPENPRLPPFFGGIKWGYQITAIGESSGRIGSANIDFVIYTPNGRIGIRIETSRYHMNTNAEQQAFDQEQIVRTGRYYQMWLVYEQDFINDPSGQSVMQIIREIFEAGQSNARPGPIASGRAIRIRT